MPLDYHINIARRRFMNRSFRGYIPVHYIVVWLLIMAILTKYLSVFNSHYAKRPVVTTMVVNGILGGIADAVAQTLTAFKADAAYRRYQRSLETTFEPPSGTSPPASPGFGPTDGIELGEKKNKREPINDPPNPAAQFDFIRLSRFITYGIAMAPVQFMWFRGLSRVFPMSEAGSSMGPAIKRVLADQLVFSPVGVAAFFSAMTTLEGGDLKAIKRKLDDMWWNTLKVNWMVWPAVQVINFRLMPVRFQLPFVSTVGIAWTAYLSLSNAAEDEEISERPADITLA